MSTLVLCTETETIVEGSAVLRLVLGKEVEIELPVGRPVEGKVMDVDTEPRLLLGTDKLEIDKVSDVTPVPNDVVEIEPNEEDNKPRLDNVVESPVLMTGRAPETE